MQKLINGFFVLSVLAVHGTTLREQTEDQRENYVGERAELVYSLDSDLYPLTVHDGSTTGGVQLVGRDAAVLGVDLVVLTNNATWMGWATTGELDGTNIVLEMEDWLESPVLTDGVASYDTSAWSDDNATEISVIFYTNTSATVVDLPYTGRDAVLRISTGTHLGGSGAVPGVTVPSVSIYGFSDPTAIDRNKSVGQMMIIESPTDPWNVARLDTVSAHYAAAMNFTTAAISAERADGAKTMRGLESRLNDQWQVVGGSNALSMAINGRSLLSMAAPAERIDNLTFTAAIDGSNAVITAWVDTNGVASSPFVEYANQLSPPDWLWLPTLITNTYPTVTNGAYLLEYSVPMEDLEDRFFRIQFATAPSSVTVNAAEFDLADAALRVDGETGLTITVPIGGGTNLVYTAGILTSIEVD